MKMIRHCFAVNLTNTSFLSSYSTCKVSKMIDQGKIQEVRDYYETDILNTYLVYLRFMMHQCDIDLDGYNRGVSDVITMIEAKRNELPH